MLSFVVGIALLSFIFTYVVMPHLINEFRAVGMVGKDMAKPNQPEIPEMGGVGVMGGFIVAVLAAVGVSTFYPITFKLDIVLLLASLCVIMMMTLLGILDSLLGWKKGIRQWQHALIPLVTAMPLIAIKAGDTVITLPLFGPVNIGMFYPLLLLPIGITGAANAANMIAGFNGLEAGMGLIMNGTILIIALAAGRPEAAALCAAMCGALLAFLKFNWYPAKIFPGDVLTMSIGATLASAVIVGNLEKYGLILMGPYFLELLLKARGKMHKQSFGKLMRDGTIANQYNHWYSIGHVLMDKLKPTESKLVIHILLIELFFSALALWSYFGAVGNI